ncbi:MAG: gluzincin family metallopeptidase [Deltaproteobacteria bacterium]
MIGRRWHLLLLLALGCRRPAPAATRPPGPAPLPTFTGPAPGTLTLAEPEPLPRLVGVEGRLTLGAPTPAHDAAASPVAPPAAPTAHPPDGPPADGVAAVVHSLSPDALATAPDPMGLPFYDFELSVEPESGSVRGRERIDYPNPTGAPLTSIPLRVFANADDARLSLTAAQEGDPSPVANAEEPSLYELALKTPIPPGGWAHVALAFSGRAPAAQTGPVDEGSMLSSLLSAPGRSPDYGLFSRFQGGIALAEWLPMVAGRWQGRFDRDPTSPLGDNSYEDLSSFRGQVSLPTDYTLAAPGVVLEESFETGRRRVTTVALADARDFPIFASRRYRIAEVVDAGIRIRSVYQESDSEPGQSVLATARAALAYFAASFHPYPYTTFTAVEVPLRGGAGGAEFPGLVAIAGMAYGQGGSLPMGLSFSPGYLGELREFVVAHEVAHQWWACAVASHPRRQPDVDEPLAQFSAALYVGHRRGADARRAVLGSQVAVNYQAMRMLGAADGPAARPTSAFSNAAEYAGLVYGKAPFFYEEALERCGEGSVARGLAAYAGQHWLGLAKRGEAATAIARACFGNESRIEALYTRYFKEAHGDEDLSGQGDIQKVALEAFAGGGAGGGAPDLSSLLNLGGGQQGSAAAAPPTSVPSLPGIDPAQAEQILKKLNQTLGGVDTP